MSRLQHLLQRAKSFTQAGISTALKDQLKELLRELTGQVALAVVDLLALPSPHVLGLWSLSENWLFRVLHGISNGFALKVSLEVLTLDG